MARSRRSIPGPTTITSGLREFLATEVAGGFLLVVAATAALVWVNSPWEGSYYRLWHTDLTFTLGSWSLGLDLQHWVNEGLMAIFFFVVGLEVKRELLEGELRDPSRAALPVVAAVGGMAVPALLYLLFNAGGPGGRGWGIPMATDISFALGVAAIIGRSLPSSLRLFLLTLAIVDDIGAIIVIAVFYSGGIDWQWATAAVGVLAVTWTLRQMGILSTPLFAGLGCVLWLTVHGSGLHATLAGVAMGFLAPSRPVLSREIILSRTDELLDVFSSEAAHTTSRLARRAVSQLEWLLHMLHPWTSLVIVPIFALANAGVPLSGPALGDSMSSPVAWGVFVGLVLGKTVGITLFAWFGCRLGLTALPGGVTWTQLAGVATLGGIGFTVSLFVTGLAFDEPSLVNEARIGILAASLLASGVGAAILVAARRRLDSQLSG